MEIAHVESWELAQGTQIGVAYEVRWQLEGPSLRLEHVGGRSVELELGDADFFDVLASPLFNSLPVARPPARGGTGARVHDGVRARAGADGAAVAPALRAARRRVVRYRSGSFEADIEFDADGFVIRYHGYLERIA